MNRKKFLTGGFLLIGILLISFVYAAATDVYQESPASFQTYYNQIDKATGQSYRDIYWPILKDMESGQCEAASDFIIMIPPGGCTPPVVRSDLLAEQNVPVFCQLDAIKVNPLIKVSSIKTISFKGDIPDEVADISFHPARAAIRTYDTLLGSPLVNNIGYVVIILKKGAKEKDLAEWVAGNLTATIHYDAQEAFGVGKAEFYLPVMSNAEWDDKLTGYNGYSFWNGKGFLRANEIEDRSAKISVYQDKDNVYKSVELKEGETSDEFYFPGFYCKAGLQVKLNKIVAPEKQARLNIDGNEIWVREGSNFLNGKCKVTDIGALDVRAGSVSIKCSGEKINLILSRKGAVIKKGENEYNYKVGDEIGDGWYLGYVGVLPDIVKDMGGKEFVLVVGSAEKISTEKLARVAQRISDVIEKNKNMDFNSFGKELGKAITGWFGSERVGVLTKERKYGYLNKTGIGFDFIRFSDIEETEYGEKFLEDYFDLSDKVSLELLNLYPQVRREIEKFSEENLWKQVEAAISLGKQQSAMGYLKNLTDTYPNSESFEKAEEQYLLLSESDYSKAYSIAYINNNYHSIRVNSFKSVNVDDKGVRVSVNGKFGKFSVNDKINLEDLNKEPENESYLLVKSIEPEGVKLVYYEGGEKSLGDKVVGFFTQKNLEVLKELKIEGDSFDVENKRVVIEEINVEKVAYVSLIPDVKATKTDAGFTFRIGIEKRGIKLSPDKTKEMIENLNKSIDKWKSINEKIGKLVSGLKGACFATSAILMVKNSLFNADGGTIARERVMKSYKNKCERLIKEGTYKTNTQCYNGLASEINNDVDALTKVIKEQDANLNEINNKPENIESKGGLFEGKVIKTDKALEDYKDSLGGSVSISVPGEGEKNVDVDALKTFEQAKAVAEYRELEKSGASELIKKSAKDKMDGLLIPVWKDKQNELKEKEAVDRVAGFLGGGSPKVKRVAQEGTEIFSWDGETLKSYPKLKIKLRDEGVGDLNDDTKIQFFNDGVRDYVFVLAGGITSTTVRSAFEIKDGELIEEDESMFRNYGFVSGEGCSNTYFSPEVRFYETSPNVRLPAIVPLDVENGWYVKVPQTVGGVFSSEEAGYQASGDVSFFYICNVGKNGRMDNMREDDICQSFDVNTYKNVESFRGCPDLSIRAVQNLATNAREAVRQVARQYGEKRVKIDGISGLVDVDVPMSGDGEIVECQDFMSPQECKILFNVCDPVICPSSRCNLGGKYKVADVIQTGIIGSIALCLPNVREGIVIPVCLSGIYAGIENYVSLLESHRKCLTTYLEAGEHVGICDEYMSIYKCDFFWRQIAPIANLIAPNIIESAYGVRSGRGGGEYLSAKHAWDNLGKSIDYFKDSYAQNAFRVFELGNVEELGVEACKMFIGTSFPTSANALDRLLEPESPTQFNAWFSEVLFTTATFPATSQYKIYYRIFAGNDRGVYYQVYLKNPPASSYYAQSQSVVITTGYLPKGETVDEAIDKTLPSGYKELCVRIDGQDKCGFKSVSTSFALDYLADKYVEEQANKENIKTEKECISGSSSVWALANPNLQAGGEEAINPEIAMRGIVRICATQAPDTNTDKTNKKWRDVGYCGNENIRCWLDSESIKDNLNAVQAVEGLKGVGDRLEDLDGIIMTEKKSKAELASLRQWVENLKAILTKEVLSSKDNIMSVVDARAVKFNNLAYTSGFSETDKAEALGLQAEAYRIVVRRLLEEGLDKPLKKAEEEEKPEDKVIEEVSGYSLKDNGIYFNGDYTGLSLIYGVLRISEHPGDPTGIRVGSIDNGVITFNDYPEDESVQWIVKHMNELGQNYKFNENTGLFILKEEVSEYYFLLNNGIYSADGKYTGLFVVEAGGGYIVKRGALENYPDGENVGTIINGVVNFNYFGVEDENLVSHMENLEKNYIFDEGNRFFILKEEKKVEEPVEGEEPSGFWDGWGNYNVIYNLDEIEVVSVELKLRERVNLFMNDKDYYVGFYFYYSENEVSLAISSGEDVSVESFNVGDKKVFDIDSDGTDDIQVILNKIDANKNSEDIPEPTISIDILNIKNVYSLDGKLIKVSGKLTGLSLEEFSKPFEGYYIKFGEVIVGTIVNGRIRLDDVFIESLDLNDKLRGYLKDLKANYIFEDGGFIYEMEVGLEEKLDVSLFRLAPLDVIYYAEISTDIFIEQGRFYAFVSDKNINIGRVSDTKVIIMEEIRYRGKISGWQLKIVEFLNGKQILGERIVLPEGEEVQPKQRNDRPVIYLKDEFEFNEVVDGYPTGISEKNYLEGGIIKGIYTIYDNIHLDNVANILGTIKDIGGGHYKIHMIGEPGLTYLPAETYDILEGAVIKGKDVFVECRVGDIKAVYSEGGLFGSAEIMFESKDTNCEGREVFVVLKKSRALWFDEKIGEQKISFIKKENKYVSEESFSLSEEANFYFEFECKTCDLTEGELKVVTPGSEEACKVLKKPYWTDVGGAKISSGKQGNNVILNVEGTGLFCNNFIVELWKESNNGRFQVDKDFFSGVFTFLNNKGEIEYTLDRNKIRGPLSSTYKLFFKVKYGKDYSKTIDSDKIKFSS